MMARFATIEDLLAMDPHGLGPKPPPRSISIVASGPVESRTYAGEDQYGNRVTETALMPVDPLAGQTQPCSACPMPPGVPTHPEPCTVLAARGSLLDALCGVVGAARREGEAESAWAKRGAVAASRKLVDQAIANDSGPFKVARSAGLRTVCGEAPMLDGRDARAVLQYLRDYEHYRGGAKKPATLAWSDALIDNAGELEYSAIDGARMPLAIEAYERARSL